MKDESNAALRARIKECGMEEGGRVEQEMGGLLCWRVLGDSVEKDNSASGAILGGSDVPRLKVFFDKRDDATHEGT